MGGDAVTTQKENGKSSALTTGSTNNSTTNMGTFNNTSTTNPYGPAKGLINSILGQAKGINQVDLSSLIPSFMGSAQNLAQGHLPQDLLDSIMYGARNTASSNAAAAGRDLTSPGYASSIGGAVTRAAAPYSLQAMSMAPGFAQAAAGLPFAGLNQLSNLILPIASQFGTTTNSGTTTGNSTGLTNMLSNVVGKNSGVTTQTQSSNPTQQWAGAGLGLLGLGSQLGLFG